MELFLIFVNTQNVLSSVFCRTQDRLLKMKKPRTQSEPTIIATMGLFLFSVYRFHPFKRFQVNHLLEVSVYNQLKGVIIHLLFCFFVWTLPCANKEVHCYSNQGLVFLINSVY